MPGLTCTPLNLADLAKELGEDVSSIRSAHVRAACNRAYYAVYHSLEPILKLVPGDAAGVGAQGHLKHREMPRRLRGFQLLPMQYARLRQYASQAKLMASTYQSAMALREISDYCLDEGIEAGDVELQLERMSDLLEFAEFIRAEIDRLKEPLTAA